ncbi:unnamed protein product [Urochloa humidicola]
MAAALKPSANVFALLESNDPRDTSLADLGAAAKADAAATVPLNINKKQQPQMSVWKANKLKAEANAAANKQQAASKAKTNTAGKNKKPQQPAASKAQVTGTAANAGKNIKRPQQPAAASKAQQAYNYNAANAAVNRPYQFQKQQEEEETPAPASLTQILFGNAYPSARALIYKHRQEKLNAMAKAKEGAAGGVPTDDKKGGKPNGASAKGAPAPVQEEPPAPVKPVLPLPPPPSLEDAAQFPSLK